MEDQIFTLDERFLLSNYSNTAFKIYKILNAYNENKDKGIRIAKETIKSRKNFEKTVGYFINYYINGEDYLDALNEIAESYEIKEKKSTSYVDKESMGRVSVDKKRILKSIYESGLSVLDYFFYKESPVGFVAFFNERCERNDKLALEINKRENKSYPIIIDIINKINNDDIDYVGYYELTRLNPYHLIAIARENDLYTSALARFISALRSNNQMNVEKELNGTLVINKEEISREVKEQAIAYLNSINAPMDTIVYNTMVRRLVKKDS